MRITRRPGTTMPGLGELPGVSDDGDAAAPAAGRAVTDRVQLSEAARLRQRLKAELGAADPVTDARVAALRTAVGAETYAPSPRAVAERLLAELAADLLA